MIFLDTNPFVIELRYQNDRSYRENHRFLEAVKATGIGVTSVLNVLETCGILSFNLAPRALMELYAWFPRQFGVKVLAGEAPETRLPSPPVADLLDRMAHRMSLKDAEIALEVESATPRVKAFVTWNAKHFQGKLSVPVLTPSQWHGTRSLRRKL